MNPETSAVHVIFELVGADKLPPGQVCDVKESPGRLLFRMLDSEITPRAHADLTTAHKVITVRRRRPGEPLRLLAAGIPSPRAPRRITKVVWVLVPPGDIGGRRCLMIERETTVIWAIAKGEMTERLIRQLNIETDRIAETGVWTIGWDE